MAHRFGAADRRGGRRVASIETADGSNPLLALAAFKDFSESIKDRCVEPPVSSVLAEVGSHGCFGTT